MNSPTIDYAAFSLRLPLQDFRGSPGSGTDRHDSVILQVIDFSGERGGNRTFNLLIKSQLLCQLSYAPEFTF